MKIERVKGVISLREQMNGKIFMFFVRFMVFNAFPGIRRSFSATMKDMKSMKERL